MALTKNTADTIADLNRIDCYISQSLVPKYTAYIKDIVRDLSFKIPSNTTNSYIRGFTYKDTEYYWFDRSANVPYIYIALPSEYHEYFEPIHKRHVEIFRHINKVKQYLSIKYTTCEDAWFNPEKFMPKCFDGWNDKITCDIYYKRIESSLQYLYALELII